MSGAERGGCRTVVPPIALSSRAPETAPARRGPAPSRCAARASWCQACRTQGRSRTVLIPSPASRRCRGVVAPRKNCSPARSRSAGRRFRPASAPPGWPGRAEGMAGDTGAKHIRAVVAGIGGQRIALLFHKQRIDRLSRRRVPAANDVVGAAGEQSAAIGQKRDRPHRQPRADQRARQMARLAIDHPNRSANARGGHQRAVGRDRDRNYRPRPGRDFTGARAAGDRKYTLPSAPPVAISPSLPTATLLSGTGIVTTVGEAEPASGQRRTLRS